jgi:glucosamine kinase
MKFAIANIGLGIDAGGTQTRWALVDAVGQLLAEGHVAGLSALQCENATGVVRLGNTLESLSAAVREHAQPTRIYAGVTGFVSGSAAAQLLIDLLQQQFPTCESVALGSDIEIAFLDVFKPGGGYIVYAGTGSIAAFIDADNVFHRAGGRGVMLDDAGGGYWIAREALRHIWRAEDECPGVWEKSAMACAVFKELGNSDWLTTRQFVYASGSETNRGDIGKLALAVAQSAAADAQAMQILTNAGAELARLANALLSRYGARPVALAGRAATLHPIIEATFRQALPSNILVTRSDSAAHVAAARIALKLPH